MKLRKNSYLLLAIAILATSCSANNVVQNNNLILNNNKFSFSIKSTGSSTAQNNDTSIVYTGDWNTVTNAGASGGNYSVGGKWLEDNDPALNYKGNWIKYDYSGGSNGHYTYTVGAKTLLANNDSSSIVYSGTGWIHAGSNRSYVYGKDNSVTIENNSGNVTYNGSGWQNLSYTNGFSDHYTYSCSNPASCPSSAQFTFNGTNIHLIGRKGYIWGMVKVSIYPETSPGSGTYSSTPERVIDNIDMYSPNWEINQTIAYVKGLKSGNHKVVLEGNGSKNPSSADYVYDFDKAIVYPSIEYEFTGTDITYKALKNNYCGIVNVSIDGGNTQSIDLYNSTGVFEEVHEFKGLSNGSHRITIEATDQKNANADNSYIMTLGEFLTYPSLNGTFNGTGAKFGIVKYPLNGFMDLYIDGTFNQSIDAYNSSILFTEIPVTGLSNVSHTYDFKITGNKNASASGLYQIIDYVAPLETKASYTFTDTGVAYVSAKGPDQGHVDVYLDGVFKETIDLYSPTIQYQQNTYFINNLPKTSHTIEIRSKGTKNASSSGYAINLDAFVPEGGETSVNSYFSNDQKEPDVVIDNNSNFVITWESNGQDGSSYGIYAQRYNSNAFKEGSEFKVNNITNSSQRFPSIAMDGNSNFVITMQSDFSDGDSTGITARNFNSDGTFENTDYVVNTYSNFAQQKPVIASASDGSFVVAWESNEYGDGEGKGIYAQKFNSDGTMFGSEFKVNTYTFNTQSNPSIAMRNDGAFVIVWDSIGQDTGDNGSQYGIYAQRFNSDTSKNGIEFKVNTTIADSQEKPSVSMDILGNFVVVWQSNVQDGSSFGIYGQRFDSSGGLINSQFQVNTYTAGSQSLPDVSMNSSGEFVVVWQSNGQDGSNNGIYGQKYDSQGIKNGDEFQINDHTTDSQENPAVALNNSGKFVVTWQSNAQDTSLFGIYKKLFK